MNLVKSFMRNEEGAGMIEYGLIIGLIVVILVIAFIILGPPISPWLTDPVTNRVGAGQNAINEAM